MEQVRFTFLRLTREPQISKAMCKQVLDPSYINRLCDAPDAELHVSTLKDTEL
jgi:hypothetical protein